MIRYYCFVSRAFGVLAVALLILANLAVPELMVTAKADPPPTGITCNKGTKCNVSADCSGWCFTGGCGCYANDQAPPGFIGLCDCSGI